MKLFHLKTTKRTNIKTKNVSENVLGNKTLNCQGQNTKVAISLEIIFICLKNQKEMKKSCLKD
jgi:hypothetical protein